MSISSIPKLLEAKVEQGKLPGKIANILSSFYSSYEQAVQDKSKGIPLFKSFIQLVETQCKTPFCFDSYHRQIRAPFDYHQFGLDFLRPLVDQISSSIIGIDHIQEIVKVLKEKKNVIFLANHQIEADPQAISLLLEDEFPSLSADMIFVAGERVVTDPLAIPFSMGCNLLCIFSKRYMDHPPEKKHEKQMHNKKTMELMSELLKEGGKCIYVAPSGGSDRKNIKGQVQLSPFDPQSVEMFYLMAKKSKTPTFFYPMALKTYDLLPPPETIQKELGEERKANRVAIHLFVGASIDMEHFPGHQETNKHIRRKSRADYIWELVKNGYNQFPR